MDEKQNGKDFEWQYTRHLIDTYEDMQKVRTAEMNRARALLYRRMLNLGYMVEEKKDEDEKSKGKEWDDDKLDEAIEKAEAEGKLTAQELEMIDENSKYAKEFKKLENAIKARFTPVIEKHPVWISYLSKIKAVGLLTAARLICHIGDASRFDTISKLWAYAGYGIFDGQAQRRKKGEKSNWNRRLKVLCFILSDGFIKQRSAYRVKIYDPERERLKKAHPEKMKIDGKTKYNDGHLHHMAMRKMSKIFLANYWLFVRKLYGLPTGQPYIIGKPREGADGGNHSTIMQPEEFFEK